MVRAMRSPRRVRTFAALLLAAGVSSLPRLAAAQDDPKADPQEAPSEEASQAPEQIIIPGPEQPARPTREYLDRERPRAAEPSADEKKPLPPPAWQDVSEPPKGTRQFWFGVRYRGTVIPKFLMNAFLGGGATVFSHSPGLELEIRKDGKAIIPHLSFAEYGMGDTVFLTGSGDPSRVNDHFFVNSTLKGIYAGADFLWSRRLHRILELEYGLGFGVGVLFGDVVVNWVYADPKGQLVGLAGQALSPCEATGPRGCNAIDHSNSSVTRVGRYVEPNWASGGVVPLVYARITLPIVGLRIRPLRDLELRTQVGLSLTEGFFFGVSASYLIPGT